MNSQMTDLALATAWRAGEEASVLVARRSARAREPKPRPARWSISRREMGWEVVLVQSGISRCR